MTEIIREWYENGLNYIKFRVIPDSMIPKIGSIWKMKQSYVVDKCECSARSMKILNGGIVKGKVMQIGDLNEHRKSLESSRYIIDDVKDNHVKFYEYPRKSTNGFYHVDKLASFLDEYEEDVDYKLDTENESSANKQVDVTNNIITNGGNKDVLEFDYENGEVFLYLGVGNLPKDRATQYCQVVANGIQKVREKPLRLTIIPLVGSNETRLVFVNPK